MSSEEPNADRIEQLRPATTDEIEYADDLDPGELPLDADPRDVADQHRPVPFDEDLDA
ncbi:MAG: hypothetical protein ACRDSL_02715 [Pseudonocardiaceae bacterium]